MKYCADLLCKRERTRWATIQKKYNISEAQFWMIVEAQKGRCPVTGRELFPKDGKQAVHIDHDHSSGIVRGVVTAYANTRLIGRLRNWQTAQNLADYLRDPPATRALGGPVVAAKAPVKKRRKRKQ